MTSKQNILLRGICIQFVCLKLCSQQSVKINKFKDLRKHKIYSTKIYYIDHFVLGCLHKDIN